MGEWEPASDAYELVAAFARAHGDAVLESRAYNGYAIVLQQRGIVDEALESYEAAMRMASIGGDPLAIGDAQLNMGVLNAVKGNFSAARASYEQSIAHYKIAQSRRGLIGSLNNLGMLYLETGGLRDAEACFLEALEKLEGTGDSMNEATVRLNLAEVGVAQNKTDDAWAQCSIAHRIFLRVGEASGIAEAHKQFALVHRERGELHLAIAHLTQAVSIAKMASLPLEEAESARVLAQLLRRVGRNRDSLAALYRARQLFEQLKAQHSQADVVQRVESLQGDFLKLVREWSDSIDETDPYTRGHCQRVAHYACKMAVATGLDPDNLIWFEMGALLHDIGKTAIPAEILNKCDSLLPAERQLVEEHPVLGEALLSDVEFPWDIRPMIRSHHERWDGGGYPDGLRGADIPLSARIIHIVDVFDALTTDRIYRRRVDPYIALQTMRADAASFDPELLSIFEHQVLSDGVAPMQQMSVTAD